MKSCHNCKNQYICAFYRDYNKVTEDGLKMRILTTSEAPTDNTTSSWMDIFRAIARSCTSYTVWDSRKELNKESKKYAKELAKSLKSNKQFIKDFVEAHSNEARIKIIDSELDNNYDKIIDFLSKSQESQEQAEDLYESFELEVMSHFGV